MAPRRSRTQQIEEIFRRVEDRLAQHRRQMEEETRRVQDRLERRVQLAVDQKVERLVHLVVRETMLELRQMHQGPLNPVLTSPSGQLSSCSSGSVGLDQKAKRLVHLLVREAMPELRQMHQGPLNPVLTSPSGQVSSCASVGLPEMDFAHYSVDDITVLQPCQLHIKVRNTTIKVALGMAYPVEPGQVLHGRKILPGYSKVRVEEVYTEFGDLDLDFPGVDKLRKLGEAIHKVILWRKRDIIFGTNCNYYESCSPPRDLPHSEPAGSRSPIPRPAPLKEKLQTKP